MGSKLAACWMGGTGKWSAGWYPCPPEGDVLISCQWGGGLTSQLINIPGESDLHGTTNRSWSFSCRPHLHFHCLHIWSWLPTAASTPQGGGAASFRKYLTNMFFYFTKISTVYLTCLGFRCLKRLTSGNFPEPLGPDFSFSPKNNPNSHPSKQKQVVWIRFWGRQTVCTGCKT